MYERLSQRLVQYWRLMRFDKPIGIYLLLWPTLWALWLAARGWPETKVLVIFMLGVVCMRAAGCIINDVADRDIDPHVARTAKRPLAARTVSLNEACVLLLVVLALAFALVCQLNRLTLELSLVGMGLTLLYPFTKRFTYWPQVVLGLTFGWGVPMAFAAQTGTLPPLAWGLYAIVALWIITYDTMYAMADRVEDMRIGVKSTAILFAKRDRLLLAAMQACILLALLVLGIGIHLHRVYYVALVVALLLASYQQFLLKDRIPAKCLQAFLNNNWFGLVIFLGLFFSVR